MSSTGSHEPLNELSDDTKDMRRAVVSLMEELEAIDWYNQRADACKDPELKAILIHNRDEEKEHAAMVLECARMSASRPTRAVHAPEGRHASVQSTTRVLHWNAADREAPKNRLPRSWSKATDQLAEVVAGL